MRTLHLACLPFPSPQGTQAIVRAMVEALADHGHDTHLLTYAHGRGEAARGVTHHRLVDFPRARSLRSGPSVTKAVLDLQMLAVARQTTTRLHPDLVIAHGVEAAFVARLARLSTLARTIYFAHTRFDAELPTYLRGPTSPAKRAAMTLGHALDMGASGLSTVAITPDLARHLARGDASVSTLLPPWRPLPPPREDERSAARAALGLPSDAPVALYAGNLDGYQGWQEAAEAARRLGATFLVATESDVGPLAPFPHRRVRLADEPDRRRAYAACDLAIVPRRSPGGLPIKLLDALARDVPVVAGPRALAGLAPRGVEYAERDEAAELTAAASRALLRRPTGGRSWVRERLAPTRFVASLESLANLR